ncbi:MAG TPA: hypothetical protein VMU69_25260 [Bradyrhizobium sp.]|nr:hypothetical protein [Bradyrhizobium sp.]
MAIIFLLFVIAGVILGTKYKVLVLLPATALSALALIAGGIANGRGLAGLLLMAFLASGCLQLGYLCGAIIRHTVIEPRANLRRLSLR